jgi:16S rRNA (cytosine1402-N4)-methyltransferase
MQAAVLELLPCTAQGLYVDGTFGGGGHTRALLDRDPTARVIALDADPEAAQRAEALQADYGARLRFEPLNFKDLHRVVPQGWDGALFDLGMSSFQLDTAQRGFSFRLDGPLDMRLNNSSGVPVSHLLEHADPQDIAKAIRDYGQEPRWKRVVQAILRARGTGLLAHSLSFAGLIKDTLGQHPADKIHPATLTFQGLRIWVNGELDALQAVLPKAFEGLKVGGVLVVISFHSGEDRLVKQFFRQLAGKPASRMDSTPQQYRVAYASELTPKALVPSAEERQLNPRSRSAKLRALQKTHPGPVALGHNASGRR